MDAACTARNIPARRDVGAATTSERAFGRGPIYGGSARTCFTVRPPPVGDRHTDDGNWVVRCLFRQVPLNASG